MTKSAFRHIGHLTDFDQALHASSPCLRRPSSRRKCRANLLWQWVNCARATEKAGDVVVDSEQLIDPLTEQRFLLNLALTLQVQKNPSTYYSVNHRSVVNFL